MGLASVYTRTNELALLICRDILELNTRDSVCDSGKTCLLMVFYLRNSACDRCVVKSSGSAVFQFRSLGRFFDKENNKKMGSTSTSMTNI